MARSTTPAAALLDVLETGNSLAIVCHDDPDPDCLASALALDRFAEFAGVNERVLLYGGDVTHQQNRAMVNLLSIPMTPFADAHLREYELTALVDHSVPGQNNQVPEAVPIDVVVDHHSVDDVSATYVDSRPAVGATATILTEYLEESNVSLDDRLATALLFGIRRETLAFMRGVTPSEYAAAQFLQPHADVEAIRRLSDSMFTSSTLDTIGRAIAHRTVRGACLVSTVGCTSERDALPQAADYLLDLEGVDTAIVFGIVGDSIQLSARTRNPSIHLGRRLDESFDDVGNAGGHQHMAGGRLPLGLFASLSADEELIELSEAIVTERLFEAMNDAVSPR
jgi:nanoRNase/pAp phosphatase (c-di-AMP/oligoRNAs hydrolase)